MNKKKKCSRCNDIKDINMFGVHKHHKDGYNPVCKSCRVSKQMSLLSHFTKEEVLKSINDKIKLPGKNFIVLRVLSITSKKNLCSNNTNYEILCDCGNIKILKRLQRLNQNVSCGESNCPFSPKILKSKQSKIPESITDNFFIINVVWKRYVDSARDRGIQFNIRPEHIKDIWIEQNGICECTGKKLYAGVDNKANTHTWSIDRIDSKKSYERDNIRLVHKFYNVVQNKFNKISLDLLNVMKTLKIMEKEPEYFNNLKEMIENDSTLSEIDEIWNNALLRGKKTRDSKNPIFEE